MQGQQNPSETSNKNHGKNHAHRITSHQVNGSHMLGAVPLSREERKNEQIIRMIER
jgi:hypothetical protein